MRQDDGDEKSTWTVQVRESGRPSVIRPFPPDSPTQQEQKSQLPARFSVIPLAQNIKMLLIFRTGCPLIFHINCILTDSKLEQK